MSTEGGPKGLSHPLYSEGSANSELVIHHLRADLSGMSDQLNPQDPFSAAPSPQAAADELRVAAGEETKHAGVKEAAVEKASALKDVVASRAAAIREEAGETAINLKDVAGEQWQDTQLKAKELQASLEDSVRANPTKAVLTAAAAGFVLGLIFRR